MKFILQDATKLSQAIARVTKATPRRLMGSQLDAMCFETVNGELFVHRYASESYAEHKVGATILEEGKIVVADSTIANTIEGRCSFEVVGNDLVCTNLTKPDDETKLRLQNGDPFLYTRIPCTIETKPLSVDLSRDVLWVAKDSKLLYDTVLFDGSDIIATNNISVVLMDNGEPIHGEPIFVYSTFFLAFRRNAKVGVTNQHGNTKVWVVDGDFSYCNATVTKPYNAGTYRSIIFGIAKDNYPTITLNKADFHKLVKAVGNVSEDNTYRNGYCLLTLKDSLLTIKSLGSDKGGEIVRTIEGTEFRGQFEVKNFPKMLSDALSTIEDDCENIVLDALFSEQSEGHALMVHSDKVFNFIPCSR